MVEISGTVFLNIVGEAHRVAWTLVNQVWEHGFRPDKGEWLELLRQTELIASMIGHARFDSYMQSDLRALVAEMDALSAELTEKVASNQALSVMLTVIPDALRATLEPLKPISEREAKRNQLYLTLGGISVQSISDFSPQLKNALAKAHIASLADLAGSSEEELLSLHWVGKKSITVIRAVLQRHDATLSGDERQREEEGEE